MRVEKLGKKRPEELAEDFMKDPTNLKTALLDMIFRNQIRVWIKEAEEASWKSPTQRVHERQVADANAEAES